MYKNHSKKKYLRRLHTHVIRLNIPMSSYLDLYRLHRNSSGNPH